MIENQSSESRGRVVMLVENDVAFDSRVQKQARSAAAAGWEVIVLGIFAKRTARRWRLGGAKVRLLHVESGLNSRHDHRRSAPLRSPLAYSRKSNSKFRANLIEARKSDARLSLAQVELDHPTNSVRRTFLVGAIAARRGFLKVQGKWVDLRLEKTLELADHRREMDRPIDKVSNSLWNTLMGPRSWRRLDPSLWDCDKVFSPEIRRLKPDIIHANDFHMLGVGARAKTHLQAEGVSTKLVWDAHEYLPGVNAWTEHPRWRLARVAFEREYAPQADAVVTVSETLAELLERDHSLRQPPSVVLNAPIVDPAITSHRSLRADCGVEADVPLMVYSGVNAPQRGISTAVRALPDLPGVHLAVVTTNHGSSAATALVDLATELGVADRMHLVEYVPVDEIVSFLSGADVGLIPILHYLNHEIALITKFLEYSHARLPILVSDVKTMSEMVLRTGQGEVFRAEDVHDFVAGARKILANHGQYVAAYDAPGLLDGWTWDAAAQVLDSVYTKLHQRSGA